jgi:uncharacterized protein with beta-barrel porin domain
LAFTMQGAASPRDGAALALMASIKVADSTSRYARYDGELERGTDDHAFTAGLRMTW